MFLYLSVIHGGQHAWQGVCGAEGACMQERWPTEVGSMHPTGIHSCFCTALTLKIR